MDWGRHLRRDQELANQVLWALVGVNVAVFVAWTQVQGTFLQVLMREHFVASVESMAHLRVWTLLTAEFSHRDPSHLLFNLLGLWMFGRRVGDALGARSLLWLYLGGAVVASAAHVAFMAAIGAPNGTIGASGAVMALAVAFARLYPNAVLQLWFFFPVPAPIAVAGFVILDVLGLFGGGSGGVANAAHLGGAAFGWAYLEWLHRR